MRFVIYLVAAGLITAYGYVGGYPSDPDGDPAPALGTVIQGRTPQGLTAEGYVRDGRLVSLVLSGLPACADPRARDDWTRFRAFRQEGLRFRSAVPGIRVYGRLSPDRRAATGTLRCRGAALRWRASA